MGCSASQAAPASAARGAPRTPAGGGSAAGAGEEQAMVPAEPPKCWNGCVMVPVGQTPYAERHYSCSRCGGRSSCGHLGGDKTRRWRCHKCGQDLCFQCHPDRRLAHEEAAAPEPDPLTRCTTVEIKRTLDRQLQELGGCPALAAGAAAPSVSDPAGLQCSRPGADSEDEFLRRCHAALRGQIAAGGVGSPEVPGSPRSCAWPSPASPTLLQGRAPALGKASEPGAPASPHGACSPDAEIARVEAELKRRTLEVQRILQGHAEAFEGGAWPVRLALGSGGDRTSAWRPSPRSPAPLGGTAA
ncbi:unnamed protein product [Prorocentrum cordatum]|uniref:Uncharacterized protein n=1 Tax=Prorocentrum cordatum TaxID=2364126 RepID=A0ABN9Q0K1_9DINO|nr:unnamed protein product [Polarella glacialis]